MTDVLVYDKARYHFEGDYPDDLSEDNAFTHTGFFLAWCVDAGLIAPDMADQFRDELAQVRTREMTGPELYKKMDGVFSNDMLTAEGNAFAQGYYDDIYLDDYAEVLGESLPSLYHVENTWRNYDLLRRRLDQRFNQWKQKTGAGHPPR